MSQIHTTKSTKSFVSITSSSELEVRNASVIVKDQPTYDYLKNRGVGKLGQPATHGSGPLGYTGFENKTKSVFAGVNRSDSSRRLVVYKGSAGITQLESVIQEDQQVDNFSQKAQFLRVDAEAMIPLTSAQTVELCSGLPDDDLENPGNVTTILRNLAGSLAKEKGFKSKAHYSETKKTHMQVLLTSIYN
jgi:hypothetical protein